MTVFATRICKLLLVLAAPVLPSQAHDGPPFPIIEGRTSGPYRLALWTHPDVGIGTFWVIVDPLKDNSLPHDLRVRIAVQPVDQRTEERIYDVPVDDSSSQLQYKALVPFDRQEVIRARVIVESSFGKGEASASVEVTPVGPSSPWYLFLYLTPFLGAGFLWFRALYQQRRFARSHSR